MIGAGLLLGFLLSPSAPLVRADETSGRVSEDALFGGAPTPTPSASPGAPSSPAGGDAKELETSNPARDAFATGEVKENALQIGGIYYQQMIVSGQKGTSVQNSPVSAPLQFDGFLDARPNEWVRGFVDARLLYDPTKDQYSNSTSGGSAGSSQFYSTATAPSSLPGVATALTPNNPQAVLDQAWLKFDIDRSVFLTIGKQHVKWGTARFWNPSDILSTQRLDPLLPYDPRLGNSMIKLDIPLESQKANFYAIALLDNPTPASTLGQFGAALRYEKVIGSTEVGVDLVSRGGSNPVYRADMSAPVGPFDIYADGACVTGAATNYQLTTGSPVSGASLASLYSANAVKGPFAQVTGGGNYSFAWRDNRQATIGLEYFYNQMGYTNSSIYPVLIFTGQYQPFYTGRNYAAIYLTAEGPDALKHTSYTFSTLGNLSDHTFISRIDLAWRVLTYLSFEPYIDAHFGPAGGEFNFALNTPPLTNQGTSVPAISLAPTLFDLGMALRMSF